MKLFAGVKQSLGGPMPRFRMAPAFEAAGTGRRAKDWTGSVLDINSLLTAAGPNLRSRARQAERNNCWIASGVESYVANTVGTGLKPQSRHPEANVRRALHKLWRLASDELDADGISDTYGLQATVVHSELVAGECFARLLRIKASDELVPLKVQLFEGDHVPYELNEKRGGNTIRAGIEVDQQRRRVAYHVFPSHPGDSSAGAAVEPERIPAEEILHIYRAQRPGQMRGQPRLTPALVKALTMHRYDDAEVDRKASAANFALFVRMAQGSEGLGNLMPVESLTDQEQLRNYVQNGVVPLEPGLIQVLPPGWDVTPSQPADVGGSYGEFMTQQGKQLAAGGFGLAYDQMTGDLSQVSFSGIRAGRNEAQRRMEMYQHAVIVYQFCRRIWRPWLEAALLAGAFDRIGVEGVSNGALASAYNTDPVPFLDVLWHAPGWPSVNPLQDAQAAALRMKIGVSSRSMEIEKDGNDPEEIDQQRQEDLARDQEHGLFSDYGSKQAESGQDAAPDDEAAEPEPAAPPPRKRTNGSAATGLVQ